MRPVVTLSASTRVDAARAWLAHEGAATTHQGFPLLDSDGQLLGVVTRCDLSGAQDGTATLGSLVARSPVVIFDDCSLRDAADRLAMERIGRLPVVARAEPRRVIGILTRSDRVDAHVRRLEEHRRAA